MKARASNNVVATASQRLDLPEPLGNDKANLDAFLLSLAVDAVGVRPEHAGNQLLATLEKTIYYLDVDFAALLLWMPESNQLRISMQISRDGRGLPASLAYDWPLLADGSLRLPSLTELRLSNLSAKAKAAYQALTAIDLEICTLCPIADKDTLQGGLLIGRKVPLLPSSTHRVLSSLAPVCFKLHKLIPEINPRLKELQALVGGDTEMVFNNVIDSLNEGVSCCDNDGCVLYSNPSMERITGYPLDEVKGKRIYEFWFSTQSLILPERVRAQHRRYEDRRLGRSEEYETQISRKDGELRWLNIKASPLRDNNGNIVGSIGVITDITERKTLEAQLLWSQKLEAVGRLAGSVAHDFNNLLTVISGYANMVLKRLTENDANTRSVESILAASAAACSLTQQLLTVSRRQVVQPQTVYLNQSVQHTTGIIRGLIGSEIELIADLAKSLPPIHVDPGQLQQVIMNLSINARDAMPNGGTLRIRTYGITCIQPEGTDTQLEPGEYVVLSVNDSGSGMDEFIRARLFEPFFTTKREGNGLGLSTVYGIVKQHGGHISVVSEPGLGSTFTIYFPAVEASMENQQEAEEQKPLATEGTETVLVVEDEETVRELVCSVLTSSGYHVIEASNGLEGMDMLEARGAEIQLMLTDVAMPQMNGIELTDRALQFKPDLKVLTMSGCTHDSTIPENIRRRAIPFLAKPFLPDTLLLKIRECLDSEAKAQR